jgi:phage shock protein PspC (stress-responsive transcriptional regulator)
VLTVADIDAVIQQIGAVDTGREPGPGPAPAAPRHRRLRRIREGQQIWGVCNGLADYAEIDVAWVRTIFVLGTLVTAGFLIVVYIALAFLLPVDATRDATS